MNEIENPTCFASSKTLASLVHNPAARCDESASRHAFSPCRCLKVRLTQTNSLQLFPNLLRIIFEHVSQKGYSALQSSVYLLLQDLYYEVESTVTELRNKTQLWVILNSKKPSQLPIQPLARPPCASRQLGPDLGFIEPAHQGTSQHLMQSYLVKWQPQTKIYVGLGSSPHSLTLYKIVPISYAFYHTCVFGMCVVYVCVLKSKSSIAPGGHIVGHTTLL